MGLLTREAILGASDRKSEVVEVPEWGGSVRVTEMSGLARDGYELEMAEKKGNDRSVRAALVARCLVNEEGKPLFTPDDLEALGQKSARALSRVFKVAVELNAMGAEKAKEALGNSEGGADGEPRSA